MIHTFFKMFYLFIGQTARGILVPQPGIEPMPPPLGALSLNNWTTREIPHTFLWGLPWWLRQ